MRYLFFYLLFSLTEAFGAPLNCSPIPVEEAQIGLHPKKPSFFIFHNISNEQIYLTHTNDDKDPKSWSSKIDPQRWSMLFSTRQLNIHCIESHPGHEQLISCDHHIAICEISAENQDHQGSKWIAENTNQPSLPLLQKE